MKHIMFAKYMTKKFLEYQLESGERKSVEDFAEYLGVSQSLVSFWMNGERLPSKYTISLLALKFGDEIYDVLKIERPKHSIHDLKARYEAVPDDRKDDLMEAIDKWLIEQGFIRTKGGPHGGNREQRSSRKSGSAAKISKFNT